MHWIYNDGGRAAAGYKGSTGDCVVRTIAIAAQLPYQQVYDAINDASQGERRGRRKRGVSSARTGVYKGTIRKYLTALGWTWTPTMHIGSGCTVHLADGELPMGRLIVSVSKHLTAVIDGVIHDTHDCSERGVTIYPEGTPSDIIPKKAYRLDGGGWAYEPTRCVYGYWRRAVQRASRHGRFLLAPSADGCVRY